jgi:hypothetical protein
MFIQNTTRERERERESSVAAKEGQGQSGAVNLNNDSCKIPSPHSQGCINYVESGKLRRFKRVLCVHCLMS